jgi:hypothetical protein
MAASLRDVEAKIGRAKGHIKDVKAEIEKVKAAARDALVYRYEPATKTQVTTLTKVPEVPLELSLALGDALHNLRAALDYLAWQLVLASDGKPDRNTYFPIRKSRPNTKPDQHGIDLPDIRPGLNLDIRQVLDKVQPYHRSDPGHHQLALLHDADIADKHHALLVTTGIDIGSTFWVGGFEPRWFGTGPFEDGADMCWFTGLTAEESDHWRPSIAFVVAVEGIKSPWARDVDGLLVRLLDYVENIVVDRCRPFF